MKKRVQKRFKFWGLATLLFLLFTCGIFQQVQIANLTDSLEITDRAVLEIIGWLRQ